MTELNSLNKFWADGGSAINAWLAINSPVNAEAMAKVDWDTVTIDCQHGMVDLGQAMTMIQTVAATGKITMCRVPVCAGRLSKLGPCQNSVQQSTGIQGLGE